MDAYVLIGNPKTRKSSVLRCLTGCANRSLRDIQTAGGGPVLRVYARIGGLQQTGTSAEAFVREVAAKRCSAVAFCLSPLADPTDPESLPDAASYLAHLQDAGWRLKALALLGQNPCGLRGAALRQFPLAPTDPVNVTAQQVRAHFGWA